MVAEENRMKFIKFTVRIDMISLATLQSIVWTTCQSKENYTNSQETYGNETC